MAHEFNLRYWGRSISVHAARNWLLGVSLPRQDKLRVLAEWLRVSPEALLLGAEPALPTAQPEAWRASALGLADQRMLQTYLRLSRESQHTVQAVVAACEALDASRSAAARHAIQTGASAPHPHMESADARARHTPQAGASAPEG